RSRPQRHSPRVPTDVALARGHDCSDRVRGGRRRGFVADGLCGRRAPAAGRSDCARAARRVAARDDAAVRALTRLDELYAIGAGTRLGYSPEEDAAHELAARWLEEAGLGVTTDEAGNLFGCRGAARIWSGSHLDTVPNGGRFDRAVGVVAAIQAAGRAAHAGTTPIEERADALVDAAKFVLHVRECAREGALATVGALEVEPGATNVVPGRVTLSVDARGSTAEALETLVEAIGFEPSWRQDPVAMSGPPLEALRGVLPGAPELVSGAGHDAMMLAAAG